MILNTHPDWLNGMIPQDPRLQQGQDVPPPYLPPLPPPDRTYVPNTQLGMARYLTPGEFSLGNGTSHNLVPGPIPNRPVPPNFSQLAGMQAHTLGADALPPQSPGLPNGALPLERPAMPRNLAGLVGPGQPSTFGLTPTSSMPTPVDPNTQNLDTVHYLAPPAMTNLPNQGMPKLMADPYVNPNPDRQDANEAGNPMVKTPAEHARAGDVWIPMPQVGPGSGRWIKRPDVPSVSNGDQFTMPRLNITPYLGNPRP